jgi:hypothetical protein
VALAQVFLPVLGFSAVSITFIYVHVAVTERQTDEAWLQTCSARTDTREQWIETQSGVACPPVIRELQDFYVVLSTVLANCWNNALMKRV